MAGQKAAGSRQILAGLTLACVSMLASANVAGAEQAAALAPHLTLRDKLDSAGERAVAEANRTGNAEACLAILEPLRALAWPDAADERTAWLLLYDYSCQQRVMELRKAPVQAFDQLSQGYRALARRHHMALWPRMRIPLNTLFVIERLEGAAAADAWLERQLIAPLLKARRSGAAEADDELTHLVEGLYGAGVKPERLLALQRRLRGALGPDARPVLTAARALAVCYRRLGRPQQALAQVEPAYQRARRLYPGSDVLAWLDSERALVLDRLGRVQASLQAQERVAAHWAQRQPPDRTRGARAEQNLARAQLALGRLDAVAEHAARAARWAEGAGALRPTLAAENVSARLSLAQARLRQQQPEALDELRQELSSLVESAFFLQVAALEDLWLGAERLQHAEHAAWARQALLTYVDRWVQPLQADAVLAHLLRARAEPAQADAARWQAVALGSLGEIPALEALAFFEQADAHAAAAPVLAVALYKRACRALQRAHQDVPTAELQRASFARFEPSLRRFLALLLDEGRLAEANQTLAFLHEGEMQALERRQSALSGPPALAAHELAWSDEVDAVARSLRLSAQALQHALDERAPVAHPGQVAPADRLQAEAALAAAGHALAAATERLRPPAAMPRDRAAAPPGAGTAEVGFVVGPEQLEVLLRLPGGEVRHLRLPVARALLARQVQQFRQLLEQPDSDLPTLLQLAQALHAQLLTPTLAVLPGDVRQLRLRLDGVLHYLPFAALHDGERYLAERYELSQRVPAPRQAAAANSGAALALGRLRASEGDSPLPAVGRELQALQRWPGSRLRVDGQFNAAALQQGLAQRPAVVHVASHFHLDPGGDARSYLLLGDGQRLSVDALARLPWQGVQLALLSGCQTGLPVDGQPLPGGLAARLRQAGVAQVLATQWRIGDAAAADWTTAFYAGLAGQDLRRARPQAAWLAQAQQRWLRTHRDDARAHPHYWAAYTWFD